MARMPFAKFLKDNPELKAKYEEWYKQEEPHFLCIDCRQRHAVYMVTVGAWQAAQLPPDVWCCIFCLDDRLKRFRFYGLELIDFTDANCNKTIKWAWERGTKN